MPEASSPFYLSVWRWPSLAAVLTSQREAQNVATLSAQRASRAKVANASAYPSVMMGWSVAETMAVAEVVANALLAASASMDSVAKTRATGPAVHPGKSATARTVAPPPATARTVATMVVAATAGSATLAASALMDCAVPFHVRADAVLREKSVSNRVVANPNVTGITAATTAVAELAENALHPTSASQGVAVLTHVSGCAAMGMRFALGRSAAPPIAGDWNVGKMAVEEPVESVTRHCIALTAYAARIPAAVTVAKREKSAT